MATKEITAKEYAAREAKAARWACYFADHRFSSEMVSRMGLHAPEWAQLAVSITRESGRKLLAPHSQDTIDAIVRNLQYGEAQDVPFDFRGL